MLLKFNKIIKVIFISTMVLLSMQVYSGAQVPSGEAGDDEKKQCRKSANNQYRECISKYVYESREYMQCGTGLREAKNQCRKGGIGKK